MSSASDELLHSGTPVVVVPQTCRIEDISGRTLCRVTRAVSGYGWGRHVGTLVMNDLFFGSCATSLANSWRHAAGSYNYEKFPITPHHSTKPQSPILFNPILFDSVRFDSVQNVQLQVQFSTYNLLPPQNPSSLSTTPTPAVNNNKIKKHIQIPSHPSIHPSTYGDGEERGGDIGWVVFSSVPIRQDKTTRGIKTQQHNTTQ